MRKTWIVGVAATLVVGGAWLLWQQGAVTPPNGSSPLHTESESTWRIADAGRALGLVAAKSTPTARSPDEVRKRLFKDGSFAGTEAAGNWCIADKKLKPCGELRSRFEYYVLGLGEVTIEEIRGLIQDEAQRENGAQLAGEIMAIWDKYWQVRTYEWRNKFVQSDRATWMPVFEEQRSVRRQVLGAPWAEAFFKDDEKHFENYYAQLESGQAPPPDPGEPVPQMAPGKDPTAVHAERVARYGEAAADRLAKADEEWAQWEARLSGAQREWERLQKASNLSDAQRKAEIVSYVKSNFTPDEQLRVQALLRI
ncbi:lipase secretion chaperone [Aquabacterium sp.]|uniref:lipase secretion chaperone n=1 Tax=Aquabacterium sp. TaxID=1872578 RepID=UPI0024875A2D|nr:lipase secretion chaperone [Aquabacterium sp.]MDI1260674.1 lipase secretion chaperone [Aquabacterium sp.]